VREEKVPSRKSSQKILVENWSRKTP